MIALIFSFGIIIAVLGFLFDAWILNWVAKKFKIADVTYKKTLIVAIVQRIIGFIIAIIFGALLSAVNSTFLNYTLAAIVGFFVFHKIFNRYYKATAKDSLKIYITYQIVSIVLITVVSLAVIIPARAFIIQPFYAQGSAMSPTLNDKDYMFIKMFDKTYKRGDIIIHKDPKNSSTFFLKRVIGLPGEKIQMKDGKVYIYSSAFPTGQVLDEPYLASGIKTYALDENIVSIGDNQYYVLGDNRAASKDSRSYGPIDKNLLIGKYWFMGLKNQ